MLDMDKGNVTQEGEPCGDEAYPLPPPPPPPRIVVDGFTFNDVTPSGSTACWAAALSAVVIIVLTVMDLIGIAALIFLSVFVVVSGVNVLLVAIRKVTGYAFDSINRFFG